MSAAATKKSSNPLHDDDEHLHAGSNPAAQSSNKPQGARTSSNKAPVETKEAAAPAPAVVPPAQLDAPEAEDDAGSDDSATYGAEASPEEDAYEGSKAHDDYEFAKRWLAAHPDVLERVKAVYRKYDAKHHKRTTATSAPFWRAVLRDFVGKPASSAAPCVNDLAVVSTADERAGTPPPGAPAAAAEEDSEPQSPLDGQHTDDGFFVVDLARVIVQYAKFKRHLPRVDPFYAMKCNDAQPMLAMISALGGGFDCASANEFRAVLDGKYQTADGIIYAHPCKMVNNIESANRRKVYLTTFDNEDELEKLRKYMPAAKAVLRIATDDKAATSQLSKKFGCPLRQTQRCLERAKELGISVVGVSFHVGSGNGSADAYMAALRDARDVFDRATALGHTMTLLDLGGGFPGTDPKPNVKALSFEQIASAVRPKLDELFPESSGVRIIAEPGRYFAESPYSLAMCIHSRRRLTRDDGSTSEVQYYTSDGKYGSFNCMIYDHAKLSVHVLKPDPEAAVRMTTIFGPTCDSIDWIVKRRPFPDLDVGDWIFMADFGAYTMAAGSKFNGFGTKRVEFTSSIDVFGLAQ